MNLLKKLFKFLRPKWLGSQLASELVNMHHPKNHFTNVVPLSFSGTVKHTSGKTICDSHESIFFPQIYNAYSVQPSTRPITDVKIKSYLQSKDRFWEMLN